MNLLNCINNEFQRKINILFDTCCAIPQIWYFLRQGLWSGTGEVEKVKILLLQLLSFLLRETWNRDGSKGNFSKLPLLIPDSWALQVLRHFSSFLNSISCLSVVSRYIFQGIFLSLNLLSRDLILYSYWLVILNKRFVFINWARVFAPYFTGAGQSFLSPRNFL